MTRFGKLLVWVSLTAITLSLFCYYAGYNACLADFNAAAVACDEGGSNGSG